MNALILALSLSLAPNDPPPPSEKLTPVENPREAQPDLLLPQNQTAAPVPLPSTESPPAASARAVLPAGITPLDVDTLAKLHHTNAMEIEVGKLAKANGLSKKVKAFGDRLIKDHTQADKLVTALGKKKGLDLTMPAPKDELEKAEAQAHNDAMARLQSLKGEAFDVEFAKMMVEGHTQSVGMVETTVNATTDKDVRSLLNKLLPVLKDHQKMAEAVQKTVKSV